jgi:DNA-directed RNA polymerase specialized sigma24 family protein
VPHYIHLLQLIALVVCTRFVARKGGTVGVSSRWGVDNSELVAAHLAGDSLAFQELVSRYRGRLLNFVDRMIGDRERAEDLVQEAFIRVYRHLHRFDTTKKFSTWIYTIASNLAKNELRNRSRSPLVLYQSLRPSISRMTKTSR